MTNQISNPAIGIAAAPVAVSSQIRSVLWLLTATVVGVAAYYMIGFEQGASAIFNGAYVHEFTHDARHLLGFPCH